MEKNFTTVTIFNLLTFAIIALVHCQGNSRLGTCPAHEVTQYQQCNLDSRCAYGLSSLSLGSINDQTLMAVCTENCAGNLANWLENECSDTFGAAYLYYACLQTRRAQVGRYCIYSLPPVYDADEEIMAVAQACQRVIRQQQCHDNCALQLRNLTSELGCCYQSIYNNTEFTQEAVDNGVISSVDFNDLSVINNPMLWSLCGVLAST